MTGIVFPPSFVMLEATHDPTAGILRLKIRDTKHNYILDCDVISEPLVIEKGLKFFTEKFRQSLIDNNVI